MPWPPRRSTSAELQLKKEITTLQLKLLWTNAELKLKTTYCELNAEYDYLDFGAKAEDFPGAFTVAPQSGLIKLQPSTRSSIQISRK
jgi:hypothetical protein